MFRLKADVARKPWSEKEAPEDYTLKAGSIVFNARPALTGPNAGKLFVGSDPRGYGWVAEAQRDQVEPVGPVRSADFPILLAYYLAGVTTLPNCEPMDIAEGVNLIASWGGAGMQPSILRSATLSQNAANAKRRTDQAHLKGVSFHRPSKRWSAKIQVRGQKRRLGLFDTPEAAAAAYSTAAREAFGQFARTA